MRPSSEVASFRVTSGLPSRRRQKKPALISAASAAQRPVSTSSPAARSRRKPSPGDARVGVLEGDDDPPHPGGDQRIDAGRGLAPMAARFETDIGGGAASGFAGPAQRLGLAMRPPARLRPAAPDDPPLIDDDAADRRVRPDRAEPAARQRQRRPHRRSSVGRCRPAAQSPSAAIRPTKSPKSLASRKLR